MLNILIYILLLLIIIFVIYNKYYILNSSEKMTLQEIDNINTNINKKVNNLYNTTFEPVEKLSNLLNNFDNQNYDLVLNKTEFINLLGNIEINNNITINENNNLYIQNKLFKQYIIDIIYPIGSFYIQYPAANSNNIIIALPDALSPSKLFGGIWEKQWNTESIFFRTEGILSYDARNNGFQDYAIKKLTGISPLYQPNYLNFIDNSTGKKAIDYGNKLDKLFYQGTNLSYPKIKMDSGDGTDIGVKYTFDNRYSSKVSDKEGRVKNRLFIIWKRTG